MKQYSRHAFSAFFQSYDLDEKSLRSLADDIAKNGQHEPIVLHEGKILDGWNRYCACLSVKEEPVVRDFNVGKEGSALYFVLGKNIHRRHLKASDIAAIYLEIQESGVGGAAFNIEQGGSAPIRDTAKALGVSVGTAQKLTSVAAHGTPELRAAVKAKDISLEKAAQASKLPPKLQGEAIAKAKEPPPKKAKEAPPEFNEDETDLVKELEASHKENLQLQELVKSLDQSDLSKEVRKWKGQYDAINGRVHQLCETENQLRRTATNQESLLTSIRKLLGVERNGHILEALKKLKTEAAS